MDCNKEEAIRAKSIADKKMLSKDFIGAHKIARKAQQLFPDLENISNMLAVCEVHCSAAMKVNGSEDWYGILQVEPTADELSIKKQYRKLALLLHPDKNEFPGAEAAFKLIGEAYRTLSDQGRRSLYDVKRISMKMVTNPPVQHPSRNSFVKVQPGVANNFKGATTMRTAWNQQQQASQQSGLQTFWTSCPHCSIKYQYYRTILNKHLRCQSCFQTFTAYDLHAQGPSTAGVKQPASGHDLNGQQAYTGPASAEQPACGQNTCSASHSNVRENISSSMQFHEIDGGRPTFSQSKTRAGSNAAVEPEFHGKGKDGSHSVNDVLDKGKSTFENINSSNLKKKDQSADIFGNSKRKKRRRGSVISDTESSEDEVRADVDNSAGKSADVSASINLRRSTRQKQNVSYNEDQNIVVDDVDDDDDGDFVNPGDNLTQGVPAQFADIPIRADSSKVDMSANNHENQKSFQNRGQVLRAENMSCKNEQVDDHKEDSMAFEKDTGRVEIAESGIKIKVDSNVSTSDYAHVDYPDPEFYDFEKSRDSSLFSVDQVWALYDDVDAMPRFYAKIRKVETPGFKVCFNWLEHEADTVHSGKELPIGCGNYRLGDLETSEERAMFSHIMPWERGPKFIYSIRPKRGQVWALHKNKDIEMKSETKQCNYFEYEIVEVLTDYAPDIEISAVHLVKVEGFVSVFARINEDELQLSPNEIFRFSHLIPSYRMTGEERDVFLKGCYELDPACLPINFDKILPSASLPFINAKVEKTDTKLSENYYSQNRDAMRGTRDEFKDTILGGHLKSSAKEMDNAKAGIDTSSSEVDRILGSSNTSGIKDGGDNCDSPSSVKSSSDYPSTEFYDFEAGKSQNTFHCGQVWALYSGIDAFPKYYALITAVELEEFKVHVSWLKACPMGKTESNWFKKNLPFGVGRFRVLRGKKESDTYDKTEVFSHQALVEATQMRNHYDIYPHTGEIWCLYRNWNPGWNESDIDKCEYDLVEILSKSDSSIKANLLVKVNGFNAVFMCKKDENGITITMEVPVSEKLRFSHLVPSFQLTEEMGGKLRGYWELDSASVPEIFLCSNEP